MSIVKYTILFFIFISKGYELNAELLTANSSREAFYQLNQKITSGSDQLAWLGTDCNLNFSLEELTKERYDELFEIGLKKGEQFTLSGSVVWTFDVAIYYYASGDYKKSLFWSYKGAMLGCHRCMGLIRMAYIEGNGVIQDYLEATKWLFLAAAAGDDWSKEHLKYISQNLNSENSKVLLNSARNLAKKWVKEHPGPFFHFD